MDADRITGAPRKIAAYDESLAAAHQMPDMPRSPELRRSTERMGGKLLFESTPGVGSAFVLELPISLRGATSTPRRMNRPEELQGQRKLFVGRIALGHIHVIGVPILRWFFRFGLFQIDPPTIDQDAQRFGVFGKSDQ